MTRYNVIRHLEAKRLRGQGLRNKEVADVLGVSSSTASILYRYVPTGNKKGAKETTRRDVAAQLREEGLSYAEIGKKMGGISRQAVHKLLNYKPSNLFLERSKETLL